MGSEGESDLSFLFKGLLLFLGDSVTACLSTDRNKHLLRTLVMCEFFEYLTVSGLSYCLALEYLLPAIAPAYDMIQGTRVVETRPATHSCRPISCRSQISQ